MMKSELMLIFFALMGFFSIVFIALPLLNMILLESPSSLLKTLQDPKVRDAICLSIYAAFLTTVIAFIFGVPLAYLLARIDFTGKNIVESIIDVPIVVPHAVAGIALLTLFGRSGLVGEPLSFFGIRFGSTLLGIMVAMLFVSSPFMINSARDGFKGVDPRLEYVARTLGASRWQSFLRISFPLAFRNILTGCVLTWARAISEFGAVIIIAYYPMTAPVLIYERYLSLGLDSSRPIAVLLLLACLAMFIVLRMITRK